MRLKTTFNRQGGMQSPDPNYVDYVIRGLAALIAWLLVVVGWAVVNDLTVQRERKKSAEEKINDLRKALDEVEELAVQHHIEEFDEARAKKIAKKVRSVSMECSHLERCNIISAGWRTASIAVKRTVTMQNFERKGHRRLPPGDDLIVTLESAFNDFQRFLMRSIEDAVRDAEPLRATLWRIVRRI